MVAKSRSVVLLGAKGGQRRWTAKEHKETFWVN